MQTAAHNASLLAGLGVLRLHPSLVQLRLLHHRPSGQPTAPAPKQPLPHRLTSLRMHNWGCFSQELHMNDILAGASQSSQELLNHLFGTKPLLSLSLCV